MRIIISPAKKMNVNNDMLSWQNTPCFLSKAEQLKECLQRYSYEELKKLLCCNDKLAELNYQRFCQMDLQKNRTPALLSYEGIQYQYMAPQVFDEEQWSYAEEHLRILSGFYGVLRPLDGVVPYRLEMQAKLQTDFCSGMYDFWKDMIYQEVIKDDPVILNLASKEYSKAVEQYLEPQITFVTCVFGRIQDNRVKVKATEAKMARGEMVRFLAKRQIQNMDEVKNFNGLGFSYREDLSGEKELVFIRR